MPGSSKRNSHPEETTEIPCLPPQPPLWSEAPSIINRNGCFFEGHQTQNSEDNIELGDGGTWPLWCGTSWDGCFFEEPGLRKDTIGLTHGCRQTQEWWRHCIRESIGISLGGRLFVDVSVCLRVRICANMGCAKWNTDSESLDTFLTWFRNVTGVHWLSFCVAGAPLWERDPSILHTCQCNAYATHMQHTWNTHATRAFSL